MSEAAELQALLDFVNDGAKKLRTGLLLCPPGQLGREDHLAARLSLTPVDYISWKSQRLPAGARFVPMGNALLMQDLNDVGMARYPHKSVLLFNLDIALSHPDVAPDELWRGAFSLLWNLNSGLVVLLQDSAKGLIPTPTFCSTLRAGHQLAHVDNLT